MKENNLSTKESLNLLYYYVSISAFLVMTVSEATKNIKNVEKTIELHPIVSIVILLNIAVLVTLHYYKKINN
jgi:hypothetical protein